MTSFFLYRSNRLEILADQLAEIVAMPRDPMEPEIVVVQSGGMQRWLSMRLADQHGICAHMTFPFPVAFAYDLCCRLCPDLPRNYPLSQERMLWNIVQQLQNLPDDPDFALLRSYVQDSSELKIVQLAERIAYHFDQYLIFRPTWSKLWEKGQASGDFQDPKIRTRTKVAQAWQSKLWRTLTTSMGSGHRAAFMDRAMNILGQEHVQADLPSRVLVFGIPTLPPMYLQLFNALAAHCPVHIFVLSPCQEYWGDLLSNKKQQHLYRQQRLPQEERPEDSTPLAGLGTVGQDFLDLILEHNVQEQETYKEAEHTTLLRQLQSDLLHLSTQSTPLPFSDHSIQVHCCHSPWREMEVLKDLILDLLSIDHTLRPQDILIMNPDIDVYAPIIQAVFGVMDDQHIPFSIADRKPTRAADIIRFFLELLELGLHRFEASRICSLLEATPIRQRLGLNTQQTQQVLEWITQSGIRWGLDGNFRQQVGLGTHGQNTWESGLSRLFLGYMTGESRPHGHIAPLALTSTSEQELLSTITAWLDDLHQLWKKTHSARTALEWRDTLLWVADKFFPQDYRQAETLLTLRRTVTDLTSNMESFTAELPTMLYLLRKRLDETGGESGYLASGLTFCGLRPMRSIPFRVICLTGLTSTAFPRQNTPPSFDLMAASPRPGDRSTREDDRYLFLESIISARDTFILTYPGFSQRDNSQAPPSVLISELLDFLDANYRVKDGLPSEALNVQHKLQAFHPDYFSPGLRLFSYSKENKAAAQALFQPQSPQPFFPPISVEDDTNLENLIEVPLETLVRFFTHPCRFLLSSRQILPARKEAMLPDEEPLVEPLGLDAYQPLQDLLAAALAHPDIDMHNLLLSWQILPPGQAGKDVSQKLGQEVRALTSQIEHFTQNAKPQHLSLDLSLGAYRLTGRIPLYGQHLLTYRVAKTNSKDFLCLWIPYLATLALGHDCQAQHIGKDKITPMPTPPDPKALLQTFLDLYAHGLHHPLPFFPRTSFVYAQARFTGRNPKGQAEALEQALKQWVGDRHATPEKDDPYLALLFQDVDPDWQDVMRIAEVIFQPILGGGA